MRIDQPQARNSFYEDFISRLIIQGELLEVDLEYLKLRNKAQLQLIYELLLTELAKLQEKIKLLERMYEIISEIGSYSIELRSFEIPSDLKFRIERLSESSDLREEDILDCLRDHSIEDVLGAIVSIRSKNEFFIETTRDVMEDIERIIENGINEFIQRKNDSARRIVIITGIVMAVISILSSVECKPNHNLGNSTSVTRNIDR